MGQKWMKGGKQSNQASKIGRKMERKERERDRKKVRQRDKKVTRRGKKGDQEKFGER